MSAAEPTIICPKCKTEIKLTESLAAVPDDPTREVPNPAWAAVDAQLGQAQAHLDRLHAEYGLEALTNLEHQRRTMRGFKTAQGKLGQKIWSAGQRG